LSPDIITVGAVILGLLFSLAATAGAYAVYRVNKQAGVIAEYKGMAERAQQNAEIWENRSKGTQAELDAAIRDLDEARQQLIDLRLQVGHLQGMVTARAEVAQLIGIVTDLSNVVKSDHAAQRSDHAQILAKLGAST
jgi:hypothetical protein